MTAPQPDPPPRHLPGPVPGSLPAPGTTTVADLLLARRHDDRVGLVAGDRSWTWREVVAESAARAALARRHRPADATVPFHIGVLLGNVPDYLFWLGGAALAGAVIVGVNPTRRGQELARDITFTQCHLLVTDAAGAELLDGLDTGVPAERVVRVDGTGDIGGRGGSDAQGDAEEEAPGATVPADAAEDRVRHVAADEVERTPHHMARSVGSARRDQLYLLLFTSGTTSAPKAVRCTQGRLADIAVRAAGYYGFGADDVCYCPMPLFHGNAIMALWAPALAVGARVALTPKFSASGFIDDVRRYGVTRFTYVGKALAYVLATPERPDDADTPLAFGFGTEASARDRAEFERRFGCRLVEGYGSSEGGLSIIRTPDTPVGALGPAGDDVAVVDPDTGQECERARIGADGRLENADRAIGELVSRSGAAQFEGYWRHPDADAQRVRDGRYWTGDLGYIDEDGFVWFAGRGDDWLRVDSENFAAAPVERILERHPDVVAAAVYAVPDPRTGDQVMAAVELVPGTDLDGFGRGLGPFLDAQSDLGTKWAPRFVRVVGALPLTATGKITKQELRRQAWVCDDPVLWCPGRAPHTYRHLEPADAAALGAEFDRHGRSALAPGRG